MHFLHLWFFPKICFPSQHMAGPQGRCCFLLAHQFFPHHLNFLMKVCRSPSLNKPEGLYPFIIKRIHHQRFRELSQILLHSSCAKQYIYIYVRGQLKVKLLLFLIFRSQSTQFLSGLSYLLSGSHFRSRQCRLSTHISWHHIHVHEHCTGSLNSK